MVDREKTLKCIREKGTHEIIYMANKIRQNNINGLKIEDTINTIEYLEEKLTDSDNIVVPDLNYVDSRLGRVPNWGSVGQLSVENPEWISFISILNEHLEEAYVSYGIFKMFEYFEDKYEIYPDDIVKLLIRRLEIPEFSIEYNLLLPSNPININELTQEDITRLMYIYVSKNENRMKIKNLYDSMAPDMSETTLSSIVSSIKEVIKVLSNIELQYLDTDRSTGILIFENLLSDYIYKLVISYINTGDTSEYMIESTNYSEAKNDLTVLMEHVIKDVLEIDNIEDEKLDRGFIKLDDPIRVKPIKNIDKFTSRGWKNDR